MPVRCNKCDKVIVIDQSQLQGTARGNCATYMGIFDRIRQLVASENDVSRALFSFNSEGACPDCKGLGYNVVDMHFMGDVRTGCETCEGKRYRHETLKYTYNGKNINDILEMTVTEAVDFFDDKLIKEKLSVLLSVGLDYIELGQSHDTFSGGEAQRLKLASQLQKKGEIYILDEPTAGLHFADIDHLKKTLSTLVDAGNSVLTIEHNMDFIASADWVIDIGPEGGDKGGEIVAEGTPREIMMVSGSYTGQYLKRFAAKK